MEFLDKKILYVGVFRNATRAIGDITKAFFLQVILIHGIKQSIIWICRAFPFVFWLDANDSVFA